MEILLDQQQVETITNSDINWETVIYPTSINKYSGSIKPTKFGTYIAVFNSQILGKYSKTFKTYESAANYIREENGLSNQIPKNIYYDMGSYYKVIMNNNIPMLIDKDDYHLIENKVVYTSAGNKPYPIIWVDGKDVQLHNIIMNHKPSNNRKLVVDHISGNYNDNRKCNLRIVSQSINIINSKLNNNTSGYPGIHLDKYNNYTYYKASFSYEGIRYGKKFKTLQQAIEWYDAKRAEIIPPEILNNCPNRQIVSTQ